jgi:FkbM family methyltransferase
MIPTEQSLALLREFLATGVLTEEFFLVDVGASGGIAHFWYCFGDKLKAVGFDPLIPEMNKQNASRPHGGIKYVDGYVTYKGYDELFPPDLQVDEVRSRNPLWFQRASCIRAIEKLQLDYNKQYLNSGMELQYSDNRFELDEYFSPNEHKAIDFIKIDTDGHDYPVLLGAQKLLQSDVLGVLVESQFQGAVHEHANVYCNIDRLLRSLGYSLFDLETYRYTRAALPGQFLYPLIAQTVTGQVCWGDALYLKDYGDPHYEQKWKPTSPQKLVKLICLYILCGLADCAAEVLEKYKDLPELASYREEMLDKLAALVSGKPISYRQYLNEFDKAPALFFPKPPPPVSSNDQRVFQLEQTIEELKRSNNSKIAALEHEIKVLRDSTSWKVTAPLRALSNMVLSVLKFSRDHFIFPTHASEEDDMDVFSLRRRVVHNSAMVRGEGPLEIVTPPQQWAYALELQVASDTLTSPLVVRLDVTVTKGAVGVAALGHDGSILFEDECVQADGRMVIERVLPVDCCSIVFRNRAVGDVCSSALIESVQTREATASEVRPEIVIDPGVFAPYKPWTGTTPAGYTTGWLGVRTRVDVWEYSAECLAAYNRKRLEVPDPLDSENVLDWVPLLEAVNAAGHTFVMIALGAGWGRWLSAGAFASEQTGREYRLVGVEAEPQHFEWMERHFHENNLKREWSRLICAAASGQSGTCWFQVGNAAAWYGQSIVSDDEVAQAGTGGAQVASETEHLGTRLRRVRAVDMEEIIGDLRTVDYIHMDIQGSELDVLSARPDLLQARVKMINIGTHSERIERRLRQYFGALGWTCRYDVPLTTKVLIKCGEESPREIEFGDGVQVWQNVALESKTLS